MIYFIFSPEKILERGDKIKVIVNRYNKEKKEFEEILLDEFDLENFGYDEENNIYYLISPKIFNKEELKEKIGNGEARVLIEKS